MALNQVRVTGNDIIELGEQSGRLTPITSFADGDYARISFPNDIMNFTIGKNRNMIASYNAMGNLAELELRLLRGSREDQFLNNHYPTFASDTLNFKFIFAKITKKLTIDTGDEIDETYTLDNGVISKAPEFISNVSGSTDQGVVVWQIKFASFERSVLNAKDGADLEKPADSGSESGEGAGG